MGASATRSYTVIAAVMVLVVMMITAGPSFGVGVAGTTGASTTDQESSSASITIQVNGTQFAGSSPILITGSVGSISPSARVLISVEDPAGVLVGIAYVPVNSSLTGPVYSYVLTPSETVCGWITGTYTVTGTFSTPGLGGATAVATTTFEYAVPAGVGTSASSTSTITCTSVLSSATSTTTVITISYQNPTPSVTVGVNWTAFYLSRPILINGTVGPLSPPMMDVLVTVDSPDAPVSMALVPVNGSTGEYSYVLVPSGLGCGWIAGTYAVTATYTYLGQAAVATTHFEYTPFTTGVATSTSSTSSTTACPSIYSLATGVTATTTTNATSTITPTAPGPTLTVSSVETITGPTSTVTSTLAVTSSTIPTWAYAIMVVLLIAGLAVGYVIKRPSFSKPQGL